MSAPNKIEVPPSGQVEFCRLAMSGRNAFSVCAGLPVSEALQQADTYLAVAESLAYRVTDAIDDGDARPELAYANAYLIEFARALLASVVQRHFGESEVTP